MGVVFACDLCGKAGEPSYDPYEGWLCYEMHTLEWWENPASGKSRGARYHVNTLCLEGSCFELFLRKNNLVLIQVGRHRRYEQTEVPPEKPLFWHPV